MQSDARAANGRPMTAKGLATRARIVAAAADLIFERGIAGTSNDAVRRAAGVSGSQMANCFSDKGELVRAVIGHQEQSVLELMRAPSIGELGSAAGLRAWAALVVDHQRLARAQCGCRYGALAGELIGADSDTRAMLAAGFTRWHAVLQTAITTMQARGELRPNADPAQLAAGLLAALQGGMVLSRAAASVDPLQAALDSALAHVECHAARAPPATARSKYRW